MTAPAPASPAEPAAPTRTAAPVTAAPMTAAATQHGPLGIRYDFNDGIRVALPQGDAPWRVRLSDMDTGNILFETHLASGLVQSSKRYFVRGRIEVWRHAERVLHHEYDARQRPVLIRFPVDTLGDPIGWFSYALKFQAAHRCRLACAMNPRLIPLFQVAYPEITFIPSEGDEECGYYATYTIAVYFFRGTILPQGPGAL